MTLRSLLACGLFLALPIFAEDETPLIATSTPESAIDAGGAILGHPFGTTEAEFTRAFGEPVGRLQLDAQRSALLYGRSYLFLFYEGKLDGLRVGRHIVDWETAEWIQPQKPFISERWTLSNGLRADMTLKKAAEVLQIPIPKTEMYRLRWSSDSIALLMQFSYRSDREENDPESYTLNGFLLTKKHPGENPWVQTAKRETLPPSLAGQQLTGIFPASSKQGIQVTMIMEGSPADLAGIKLGDVITMLNGQSTVAMSEEEFARLLRQRDSHELVVQPNEGDPRSITLTKVDGGTLSGKIKTR